MDAAILHAFPSTTRAFVREAISTGNILLATAGAPRRADKGLKLRQGSRLIIRELLEEKDNLVAPGGICPAPVYEDDDLLAFDKPSGMPVQPLSCRETGTLANAVAGAYPECRPLGDRPLLGGALHRIDADTSGLVLFARSENAFNGLRQQFTAQTVRKTYLALVEGSIAAGGTLENDLVHDPTQNFCRMIDARRNRLTRAQAEGLKLLHAITEFRPLAYTTVENEERTLLEVTIHTGVTHQIRAQLSIAGMHIVNDRLYGAFAVEHQVGHCLHAFAADFIHPTTNAALHIETPRPEWARI